MLHAGATGDVKASDMHRHGNAARREVTTWIVRGYIFSGILYEVLGLIRAKI